MIYSHQRISTTKISTVLHVLCTSWYRITSHREGEFCFPLLHLMILFDASLVYVTPNCSTMRKRAKQQLWAENQVLVRARGRCQMILHMPSKKVIFKKMILSCLPWESTRRMRIILSQLNVVKIMVAICSEGILNCETLS